MPWFACNSQTGELLPNHDELYESVRADLEEAMDNDEEFHELTFEKGETRFFTYGMVTVIWKCIEPLQGQGSYCTWTGKYVSHGGTVLWLRTNFDLGELRHYIQDEKICVPM